MNLRSFTRKPFHLLLVLVIFALTTYSQGTVSNFTRGEDFRKLSQWDSAIDYYTRAIDENEAGGNSKVLALIYARRCACHFNKNAFNDAIKDCTEAIRLDATSASAYHFRGLALRRNGDVDKAIVDFGKLIELNPKVADGYFARGIAYSSKRDFDRALEDYNIVIGLAPTAENFMMRAIVYRNRGDLDKAMSDYDAAIRLDSALLDAYIGRGNVYYRKKDLSSAYLDFSKAIQLNYNSRDGYFFRAIIHAERGNYDQAIADFSEAIRIAADDSLYYAARAEAYVRIGKYREAASDLAQRIRSVPTDMKSVYKRAWANLYANDGAEAYADAELFLKQIGPKGNEAAYSVLIGYLGLRKAGKPAEAKSFLTAWTNRFDRMAWTSKLMSFLDGSITDDQLLALATDNGKLTEAHAYIGEMCLLKNDIQQAKTHFNWVLEKGTKGFFEHDLATAEMGRLSAAGTSVR